MYKQSERRARARPAVKVAGSPSFGHSHYSYRSSQISFPDRSTRPGTSSRPAISSCSRREHRRTGNSLLLCCHCKAGSYCSNRESVSSSARNSSWYSGSQRCTGSSVAFCCRTCTSSSLSRSCHRSDNFGHRLGKRKGRRGIQIEKNNQVIF